MTDQVTVFSDRYATGWNGDPDVLERGELDLYRSVPLREALDREWPTDAHFAGYVVPGEEAIPRHNKASVAWYLDHAPASLPELRAVGVDVDLPDHGAGDYGWHNRDSWPQEWRRWWERIQRAQQETPELQQAGIYLTRGGLRFAWPLAQERWVPVTVADSYLEQFFDYLEDRGLPLDRTDEWNRLYRLPRVVRDDVAQRLPVDLSDMEPLGWRPSEPLWEARDAPHVMGEEDRTAMPDPESLDRPNLSELNDFDDCWFHRHLRNGLSLAEPGERHDTVLGVASTIVHRVETTDPTIPFQILAPCVETMQAAGEDARPPWDEVWEICRWVCRVQDGQEQLTEQEQQTFIEEQALAMNCAPDEVRQRLVLVTKSPASYYVWDEVECEYASPTSDRSTLPMLLQQYCPRLSGIALRDDRPGSVEILRQHGQPVDSVTLSYSADSTRYEPEQAKLVRDILRRDPTLTPKRDPEIHRWLELLFADRAENCLDWLASFLHLDRPTCALYIHGPPDVGKGMLAAGLARFWRTTPVPYGELTENFQGSLVESPLIVADEKVPEDPFRERGSSVFRRVIGTGRFRIERKYMPKADLRGCPRVLITANNADALAITEALEQADIEAIQQRIGYVRTDEQPRDYLDQLASDRGIPRREMTEQWVAGGGLAQHVLWLAQHRDVEPGDRFLVEGWQSKLTENLAITFGSAPLVGKFVCRVIRDRMNVPGVRYGDGEIFLNLDYLRRQWNRVMGQSSRVPGDKSLMSALKVLSEGQRQRIRPEPDANLRYYWRVDVEKIARIAEEFYVTDSETIRTVVRAERGSDGDQPSRGIPLDVLEGGEDEEQQAN